jgi:hypothetical protein
VAQSRRHAWRTSARGVAVSGVHRRTLGAGGRPPAGCRMYSPATSLQTLRGALQGCCNEGRGGCWAGGKIDGIGRLLRQPTLVAGPILIPFEPSLTAGPVRPADRSREAGREAEIVCPRVHRARRARWRFHVGPR